MENMVNSLLHEIEDSLSSLADRDKAILASVLGLHGQPPHSYAAIGRELSISRERVRQLFNRAYSEARSVSSWPQRLYERIEKKIEGRKSPLRVYQVEVEDPWFEGIGSRPETLAKLLRISIPDGGICVKRVGGHWSIVHKDVDIVRLKEELLQLLEAYEEEHMTESDLRLWVKSILAGKDRLYLLEDVYPKFTSGVRFKYDNTLGEKVVYAVGNSLKDYVSAVMRDLDKPAHYSEIASQTARISGKKLSESFRLRVHQVLVSSEFLRYGRGIYGTSKHFPLSESPSQRIISHCKDIISRCGSDRQWSSSELTNILLENKGDTLSEYVVGTLDKYILSILLDKADSFVSLGRMLYQLTDACSAKRRLELSEVAEFVLRTAGKPLSGKDLTATMREYRSVGNLMALQKSESIARVAPGVWGLIERDFPITRRSVEEIFRSLQQYLEEHHEGLAVDEIEGYLLESGAGEATKHLSELMFLELVKRDGRFSISNNRIILV